MNTPVPEDSLKKRSFYKLASNVATIPLFFVMEAVLPRVLGPVQYGNYNFACNFFTQFISLFDMGSPLWFSTALAQKPKEFALVAFYTRFVGLIFLCITLGAFGVAFVPMAGTLLPNVPAWIIFPAALWAYLTWLGRVTRSTNDALGVTTSSEIARITVNVGSALILVALFFANALPIAGLMAQQNLTLAALSVVFCWLLRHRWQPRNWHLTREQWRTYATSFRVYCGPLLTVTICSTLALFLERWMLQFFDGSVQQGYFSLAQKASMACFLFVSAVTPLVMRELAVAHGQNNLERMRRLMESLAPLVYAVAAWFSCFTAIEGEAMVRLFGGSDFAGALITVQVMTLYAIHQTYGQVASSVFYATGQTRTLRNLNILSLAAGLVVAWVLLAPTHLYGLNMGATGLAIKTVGVQFFSVNMFLIVCRRIIPFNYGRNLLHQLVCPAAFAAVAFATRNATLALHLGEPAGFLRFIVSGMAYAALTAVLVLALPALVGLTRADLGGFITLALRKVRRQ